MRRALPALVLFLLSPLIAEFLLGSIAIDLLAVLLVLAPMYGGGAVLIREIVRRTGRGWPAILLLGLAHALVEEGLVIQTLFNPSYAGESLLGYAAVPVLGIGGWWTLFVLTLHTVWSIGVSVALVEALTPRRRTEPWLGKAGLTVVAAGYVLGLAANFSITYGQESFMASAPQLAGTLAVIVVVAVAAFRLPRRLQAEPLPADVPDPWWVGGLAFLASSLFMAGGAVAGWAVVVGYLVLYAVVILAVARWSGRTGWSAVHVTALAGGALLTYAWYGFVQPPVAGSAGAVDLAGNAGFAAGALVLLTVAVRRTRRAESGSDPAERRVAGSHP